METRQERGKQIAQTCRIEKTDKGWKVPSQSGHGNYLVWTKTLLSAPECTCPDYELRKITCKHIHAVETILKREIDNQGNVTVTAKRRTYGQNWSAYTQAQYNEKQLLMNLLADLCKNVEQEQYEFGRPSMPMADMIFSSALKVYSTFSLRRFMTDMNIAKEQGHIEKTCSYVSVSNYMRNPKMTPILHKLIRLSALPLASVENTFAVDSSGFSTCRFARYFSFKHQRDIRYKSWIKAHISVGTKAIYTLTHKICVTHRNCVRGIFPYATFFNGL